MPDKPLATRIYERYRTLSLTNILPNTQFGFRTLHSTIHQAHRVIDPMSLEKKNFIAHACF